MESYLPENPRALSIATVGEVFNIDEIVLMLHAAEELNLTEPKPRYIVELVEDCMVEGPGGKDLADNYRKVRIRGAWVDGGSLSDLWERKNELRGEQANQ